MHHSALILFVFLALAGSKLRAGSIAVGSGFLEEFDLLTPQVSGLVKGEFAGVLSAIRSADAQFVLVCSDLFPDIAHGKPNHSPRIKFDEADASSANASTIWEIGLAQTSNDALIETFPGARPDAETLQTNEESLELNPKLLTGLLCCFTLMALAWVAHARYILP